MMSAENNYFTRHYPAGGGGDDIEMPTRHTGYHLTDRSRPPPLSSRTDHTNNQHGENFDTDDRCGPQNRPPRGDAGRLGGNAGATQTHGMGENLTSSIK